MPYSIMDKLFRSFTELEAAINGVKATLQKKAYIPQEILARISLYDGILSKQRCLAYALFEHINRENWDEVSRHVGLINGLSAMIRDDVRAVLDSITSDAKLLEADVESRPLKH